MEPNNPPPQEQAKPQQQPKAAAAPKENKKQQAKQPQQHEFIKERLDLWEDLKKKYLPAEASQGTVCSLQLLYKSPLTQHTDSKTQFTFSFYPIDTQMNVRLRSHCLMVVSLMQLLERLPLWTLQEAFQKNCVMTQL